ncbi:bis(5'-nucleosyl)-tetraphosphatase (symmetrical) YqeK [Eubacterium sp.]|uniref:bis(5'-nucleosyl)-tetraphosphatase (symmetrical) YqeK n=1 Tax=Eubacterium sp. TaxID=142586 RepID=UPI002FC98AE1
MTEQQMRKKLKGELKPKRYEHTLNVVKSAELLAARYPCDLDQARLAALLHDCAKNYSGEKLLSVAASAHMEVDAITRMEPQLLHGPVGAVVAQRDYGITETAVLSAIHYHTTGRVGMSTLEKIIYLADFIEEDRNYPGVEKLRVCAMEDLDRAMILAFSNTIRYIASIGGLIHPSTVDARNSLVLEQMQEEIE